MNWQTISPTKLHAKLKTDAELALLDVREHGVHAQGHPFFAVPAPLSHLELDASRLVPRKTVPVYLLDQNGDEGLTVRAAIVLADMGYSDVAIVEGGAEGWHDAGLEVFSGVNVPSKAFGEVVEHGCDTPHISADELQQRLGAGEKITILDSRPFDEYHRMCIPGGIDAPGAELVHRVYDIVPDEKTPIVVNCAGRTRSIIGAQSLINAGIKNPVMALKDGTMGWYLAGHELERKAEQVAKAPSAGAYEKSLSAAKAVAEKTGVLEIDVAGLNALKDASDLYSLFLLDVRTEEEFLTGHIAGSQHAPGGQLVQATDEYVGVRNATLVLVDDQKVRALMTASWLKQLGWEKVSVFTDLSSLALQTGPAACAEVTKNSEISVHELDAVLSSGEPIAVIDLANSLSFRAGHIPGAYWIIRSRIAQDLMYLPPVGLVILTADDDRLAHLAAEEITAARPEVIVRVLGGGNKAWADAGMKIEAGEIRSLSQKDDIWYKPYDNKEKIRERMQEYLDWEVALVGQVERDGVARFKLLEG